MTRLVQRWRHIITHFLSQLMTPEPNLLLPYSEQRILIQISHQNKREQFVSKTAFQHETYRMTYSPPPFRWCDCPFGSLRNCVVRTVCVLCTKSLQSCLPLTYGLYPARLLCPWDSPGKNTGDGSGLPCPPLGNFPTQGSISSFLHLACIGRQVLYH